MCVCLRWVYLCVCVCVRICVCAWLLGGGEGLELAEVCEVGLLWDLLWGGQTLVRTMAVGPRRLGGWG